VVGYQAPQLASDYFAKQGMPKDAYILDTACGTGWAAILVKYFFNFKKKINKLINYLFIYFKLGMTHHPPS
jgi:hypothetical protein